LRIRRQISAHCSLFGTNTIVTGGKGNIATRKKKRNFGLIVETHQWADEKISLGNSIFLPSCDVIFVTHLDKVTTYEHPHVYWYYIKDTSFKSNKKINKGNFLWFFFKQSFSNVLWNWKFLNLFYNYVSVVVRINQLQSNISSYLITLREKVSSI